MVCKDKKRTISFSKITKLMGVTSIEQKTFYKNLVVNCLLRKQQLVTKNKVFCSAFVLTKTKFFSFCSVLYQM